jgi:hypothetical protein
MKTMCPKHVVTWSRLLLTGVVSAAALALEPPSVFVLKSGQGPRICRVEALGEPEGPRSG